MQVFINELSLEGQFYTAAEFTEAVEKFTAIFFLINETIKEKQMYKNDQVFLTRQAIRNEAFQASFQRIANRQLKDAFRGVIFNKLNPKDWLNERLHSSDDWFHCTEISEILFTDTSIAELAERKLQNSSLLGLLISFSPSTFSKFLVIEVVKNEQHRIKVDCVAEKDEFIRWLDSNQLSKEYDFTSHMPPRDEQTILVQKTRFAATTHFFQGRRVYLEVETKHYWYVDNFHNGAAAHLEVFDNQGQHIGEADLNGAIDRTKIDPTKNIAL